MRRLTDAKIQRYAAILASVTTIISLGWGFFIFRQAAKDQADTMAVKMLNDYLQFNLAHQEIRARGDTGQIDAEYLWFAAQNVLVAETIYRLNAGDPQWDATVVGIVKKNKPYLLHKEFPCGEYDPQFIRFLQDQLKDEKICP